MVEISNSTSPFFCPVNPLFVGPEATPPPKLISTYQIRGNKLHFMLARLLGFTLDNRGGLAPKIDST